MKAVRALATGTLLTALFVVAPAVAAPAAGTLVSVGTDGQPTMGPVLKVASPDGRFVLFGAYLQEGDPDDNFADDLFLRDTQTGVTKMVLGRNEIDAVRPSRTYTVLDLSDDGRRVLLARQLTNYDTGAITNQLVVRDVAARTTTELAALPGGAAALEFGVGRFTGGGTGVVYGAREPSFLWSIYERPVVGGQPSLMMSDARLLSASRDGRVITWARTLFPALPPAAAGRGAQTIAYTTPRDRSGQYKIYYSWPTSFEGTAVGYTVRGDSPRVVGRTTVTERLNTPGASCLTAGTKSDIDEPGTLLVDDSGNHLWYQRVQHLAATPADDTDRWNARGAGETTWHGDVLTAARNGVFSRQLAPELGETGARLLLVEAPDGAYPNTSVRLTPAGDGAPLPALPELPGLTSTPPVATGNAQFFAHDTGLLRTQSIDYVNSIVKYAPLGSAPAPVAKTPVAAAGEVADSAFLTAKVDWASCPPDATFPVGSAAQYAPLTLAAPVTTKRSAGVVAVHLTPAGVRAAATVTIRVQTLGATTWSRTVTNDGNVALPRPLLWVPQRVAITIRVPAAGSQPATTLTRTAGWTAKR